MKGGVGIAGKAKLIPKSASVPVKIAVRSLAAGKFAGVFSKRGGPAFSEIVFREDKGRFEYL
jgi:hypothetical protein